MRGTNGRSSIASLQWFNFFIYGAMALFASFFQLYWQDAGMNKLEIGLLLALGPFVSVFAHPFWSMWGERFGNLRRTVLAMITGMLVLTQFIFQAMTYEMVYFLMLLFFFCQTPLFAQSNTLILGYLEGKPERFGTFRLWGTLGWSLTALGAGFVLQRLGLSVLSYLVTALLCAAMLCLVTLPRPTSQTATAPEPFRGLGRVLVNPFFLIFLFFGILVSISNTMNYSFMSLYITDLGGSRTMVGLAVFLSSILETAVLLLCHRYLKRRLPVMLGWLAVVSLLFSLRWWLMAGATLPLEAALVQILHCLTFGGFFYVGTQVTSMLVPAPFRSSGQAVYTMAWSGLSGISGSILGGWLFQYLGAQSMYQFSVFLALIGAIGFGSMAFFVATGSYRPSSRDESSDDEWEEEFA